MLLTVFAKNAPPQTFGWDLNMALVKKPFNGYLPSM